MNRDEFEQLVSEWLDHPDRDDLRTKIGQAAAEIRELAALRDEWLRINQLICESAADGTLDERCVDWARFGECVSQALDEASIETGVKAATEVERRVNWPRFRDRVSSAIGHEASRPTIIRFPRKRMITAAMLFGAAAAALIMMFSMPSGRPPDQRGFARSSVVPLAERSRDSETRTPSACVSVLPLSGAEEHDAGSSQDTFELQEPRLAEVFLMVSPIPSPQQAEGLPTPLSFN